MMAQSDPIEPQYTTDEKSDLAVLRVSCYIPNLAVSRKFTAKKLRPKIVKQAENAEIKTNFKEDSFTLTVTGSTTGAMKGKVYGLNIRKLHKPIVPEESTYQVKEDRVAVLLRKKVVESWYPELEEGLDAYEEPEEEEETPMETSPTNEKTDANNAVSEKMDQGDKG